MQPDLDLIAETFSARAASYALSHWHKRCAERLVELSRLRQGDHVLDAATGTGFAAFAAARAVGREGHVRGVDISSGMLREARATLGNAGLTNMEFIEADAVRLPHLPDKTFDVVTCAAGLLYMSATDALREWYRLLKENGHVAFSTMRAGSPKAGRIFRDCAAALGVSLRDPSEPLGSASACRLALEAAGFETVEIVEEPITFTPEDLSRAWDSNFRSPAHADVRRLTDDEQRALKGMYLSALAREEAHNPEALSRSDVLYAMGRR